MSISTARTFLEKSGCGLAVGIALMLVMVFSLFNLNSCGKDPNSTQDESSQVKLATIGGASVTLKEFSTLIERQMQSMGGSTDPATTGMIYANVAQSLVSRALVQSIASEKGLTVSDQEIRDEQRASVDSSLLQYKIQMIQSKLLKADATEADFASAYEIQAGRSLADAKKQIDAELEKAIADPAQRADLAFSTLGKKVTNSYKSTITLTDTDLKKGFDTYTTKRIIAYSNKQVTGKWEAIPKASQDKLLADAQAALKGGMSFEDAMGKFSDDPKPATLKTKGESTVDLQYSILTFDKALEPILKLKIGEVSAILQTSSGPAIYKLYKIQSKIPADFEKSKVTIREGRINELANKAASEDLRRRLKDVKYESKVLKELVDWRVAMSDPEISADKAKRKESLKKSYEAVKDLDEPILGENVLSIAQYAIFKDYFDSLSPEEMKEFAAERLELMAKVLEASPHIQSSHELAKLALEQKDADVAVQALTGAMDLTSGSSPEAEKQHKSQKILIERLVAANIAKPDQIQGLRDVYARWESDLSEEIRLAAEGNTDHSDAGENEFKAQLANVDRFEKAGYIKPNVASELRTELNKWKTNVFADVKAAIELNEDYSEPGQAEFSNLNARIERFFKAGYITAKERDDLMAQQGKWKEKKKAYDAELAKSAPKPDSKPKAPSAPGSSDLLNPTGKPGN